MNLAPLHTAIQNLLAQQKPLLIAIDGPCASGKSTLANQLGQYYTAPVVHMDDFFLPPALRTEERLCQPGGNIDSQRFLDEVLTPLSQKKPLCYRPWQCKSATFGDEIMLSPAPLVIVEGAYALRPDFREFYDLRIFLSAPLPLRLDRIRKRNGEDGLTMFQNRWIPLENVYFETCNVERCCQIQLSL